MRKLQKKMMCAILSVICLNSCESIPEIRDLDQNQIFLVLETDQNGRRYINEDESACFIRKYRHNKDFFGPISQAAEHDIMDCQKSIGYNPENYGDLSDYFEKIRKKISKKLKK